jgi:tetratricopeptide (TPR) repeat protein
MNGRTFRKQIKKAEMDVNLEDRIGEAYTAHQEGRLDVAERMYRELLLAVPRQVDVLFLLSSLLLKSQPREAVELARQSLEAAFGAGGLGVTQVALHDHYAACLRATGASPSLEFEQLQLAQQLDPGTSERLFHVADALRRAGALEQAITTLEGFLVRHPDNLNARTNLGALQFQSGLLAESIANLQKVIKAKPNHAEALTNLGNAFSQQNRLELAVERYRQAVKFRPDFADAWFNLAGALQKLGRLDEALAGYRKAIELNPRFETATEGLNSLYVQVVPRWHFVMMNDRQRNEAYDQAICRQVKRRKAGGAAPLVLDIGAGSGLLSMMAARAGAETVVACEMLKPVADKASEIISRNGHADRIKLHATKSNCLQIGKELPRGADMLVTEIFDVGLLGEFVLPALAHARRNLLADAATIVPARARVWMMPIESNEIHAMFHVDNRNSCGFDLEAFNEFAKRGYEQLALRRYAHTALADPVAVFDFDFAQDIPDRTVVLEVKPSRGGLVHAWVFWFTLYLDDQTQFDTGPFGQDTCWAQAVQVEARPVAIARNMPLLIKASQSQTNIRFAFADSGKTSSPDV